MSIKHLCQAVVVDLKLVGADNYILTLKEPLLSRDTRAGQFVEIKIPQCNVLWRRPFSVHDIHSKEQTLDILFHAVGRGTEALTHLRLGEPIDLLGPLGNHFSHEGVTRAVAVAGGLGIAPFMLMMRELRARQIPMTLLYGVGRAEQFCRTDDLAAYADVLLTTADGSRGRRGLVTELLEEYLSQQNDFRGVMIYACGPTAMLRRVQEIVEERQLRAQVSVETVMACGFGACVGCAVPMRRPIPGKKEYLLACKDGPVFNIDEIIIHD